MRDFLRHHMATNTHLLLTFDRRLIILPFLCTAVSDTPTLGDFWIIYVCMWTKSCLYIYIEQNIYFSHRSVWNRKNINTTRLILVPWKLLLMLARISHDRNNSWCLLSFSKQINPLLILHWTNIRTYIGDKKHG